MGIKRTLPHPATQSSFAPPYNFTRTGCVDAPREWAPAASQARRSESWGCSPGTRTELSLRSPRTKASTRIVKQVCGFPQRCTLDAPLFVCTARLTAPPALASNLRSFSRELFSDWTWTLPTPSSIEIGMDCQL